MTLRVTVQTLTEEYNQQLEYKLIRYEWIDVRTDEGILICQVRKDNPAIIKYANKGKHTSCVRDLREVVKRAG